jgi:hypothetical protein
LTTKVQSFFSISHFHGRLDNKELQLKKQMMKRIFFSVCNSSLRMSGLRMLEVLKRERASGMGQTITMSMKEMETD